MAATLFEQELSANGAISRPPSVFDTFLDRSFRGLTFSFAWFTILLVLYIFWEVGGNAIPAMEKYGLNFLTSTTWDVNHSQFGVLPEIWGTLYSSGLALLLGGFFGVSIAILLTQEFLPPQLEVILKNIIELLAAIPSVVYGLWGIFVVIPTIRPLAEWLHSYLSWIPFLGTSLTGPGMLLAALVLTIMILRRTSTSSRNEPSGLSF